MDSKETDVSSKTIENVDEDKQVSILDSPLKYVEISPNKQYIRFEEIISKTKTIKTSYKAFDTLKGIEVSWHTINLIGLSDEEQIRIIESCNYLKDLQCKNVMEYLHSWTVPETKIMNIITTRLDSLREFIGKVKTLKWRIVKKWCKQILLGMEYLHNNSPQIIHRDLTCSHIYMNGNSGNLYIGSMWMAAILTDTSNPISLSEAQYKNSQLLGSPSYNAPEVYETSIITPKMDIYSFGMCVLYIITREDPYLECNGVISKIIDRILHKKLPNSLSRVTHSTALNFITSCLQYDFNARPSATELLNHHFLEFLQDEDDMEVSIGPEVEDDYTYSSTLLSHHTRFSGSNETTNDSISPVSNDRTEIDVASNNTQTLDSSTTPIKSSSDVPSSNVGNNSKVNMKEVGTSPFITIPTIQEGYPSKIDGTERVNYSMIAVSESSLSGKLFDNDVSENINQNNNISPGLNTESVSSSQMKEVIINLKVDATHSSDGLEKHVEFVFNIEKDNSMVIATEMIDELKLLFTVSELSDLIQSQISLRLNSNNADDLENPPSNNDTNSKMDTTLESIPEDSIVTSEATVVEFTEVSTVPSTESQVNNGSAMTESISRKQSNSIDFTSSTSASVSRVSSHDIPDNIADKNSNASKALVSDPPAQSLKHSDSTGNEEDKNTTVAVSDQMSSPDAKKKKEDSKTISSPKSDSENPADTTANENSTVTTSDPLGHSDSMVTSDDPVYLEELEKIEKESRAARRAFEKRIEKHKIIQETCENDLLKLESDYASQLAEHAKKEKILLSKKEEELKKLKEEFELRIQKLNESRKNSLLQNTQSNITNSSIINSLLYSNQNTLLSTTSTSGSQISNMIFQPSMNNNVNTMSATNTTSQSGEWSNLRQQQQTSAASQWK